MKTYAFMIAMLALSCLNEANGQWTTSGSNIYNTNTGNVGIGNNAPTTLLHAAKLMTEPTITVQNLGGAGGATYTMIDALSGANWKFKATNTGGFKIRDHANLLDVIVIEPNSAANALYINGAGYLGLGTALPGAKLDVNGSAIIGGPISFYAPPTDDPSPIISVRTVPAGQGSSFQKSELILFHGNDNANGAGIDQITLRAPALNFQTYDHSMIDDMDDDNGFNVRMYIKPEGNIGIGTTDPAASAALDITSTTKGFLPPRMTQAQIEVIESPANGLIVFCTTDNKFYGYLSSISAWKEILFGTGTIYTVLP